MKVSLLGDVALFGINSIENGDYKNRFAVVKRILEDSDYVIANLETPITNAKKTVKGKSAYLKANPQNIDILKYLGITHVSLANNHIYDYCKQGLEDTISYLESNRIHWYGINGQSAHIEQNENKIYLTGYCCYSTNGKGLRYKEPYINVLDPEKMIKDIQKAEDNQAIPILSCHWGQEHVHYPNYDHIDLVRKIVQGKTVVVHGHHPHVIQGIEKNGNSLIFYSQGNFCFDDVYTKKSERPLVKLSNDNQETFIIRLNIENNNIVGYEVIPISFIGGIYTLNNSIIDKIKEWSECLDIEKEEYILKRQEDINEYISKRKSLRNIEWYVRRLNLESVRIIVANKQNAKKYNKVIKNFINK